MTDNSPHADQFIEQLGRLMESDNLPRTAGRMMGLLILSGAPLGIDQISSRLRVSRASVSTNSRLLQSLALAQLVREPGSRRDYLQISGDSCTSVLALGLQRMQAMRTAIHEMRLAVSGGSRSSSMRTRLQRMEKTYDAAIVQLQAVLGDWRGRQAEPAPVVAINLNSASVRGRARRPRKRASRPG